MLKFIGTKHSLNKYSLWKLINVGHSEEIYAQHLVLSINVSIFLLKLQTAPVKL